jgi:hypothetical protein
MFSISHCFREDTRDAHLETKGTICNTSIHIFAYSDDIDIVGRTVNSVKEAIIALSAAAKTIELTVNEEKTKFMEVTESL